MSLKTGDEVMINDNSHKGKFKVTGTADTGELTVVSTEGRSSTLIVPPEKLKIVK